MSTLSIIFITVLICAEIDFLSLLYFREFSDWLNAKSEEIRARAEALRKMSAKADTRQENKTSPEPETETDSEIFRREGSE